MIRHYLTEDVEQIQRYFPGAQAVVIRTPFDITPKQKRIITDLFCTDETTNDSWQGRELQWTN